MCTCVCERELYANLESWLRANEGRTGGKDPDLQKTAAFSSRTCRAVERACLARDLETRGV